MRRTRLLRGAFVLTFVMATGPFVMPASAQQSTPASADLPPVSPPATDLVAPPPPAPRHSITRTAKVVIDASEARVKSAVRHPLLPLYASFAVLEVLDANSTLRSTSNNGYELSPAVRPFASNGALLYAVKTGVAAGTIYFGERLWKKKNRAASIALMTAINCAYTIIVVRNYGVHASR